MYSITHQTVHDSLKGMPDPRLRRLSEHTARKRLHRGILICDACRQRKSRCIFDDSVSVCTQCVLHGTKCCALGRKSRVESLKRSQRVRLLEAEIRRMENVLRSAGIDPGDGTLDSEPGDDQSDFDTDHDDDEYYDYQDISPNNRESTSTSPPEAKTLDSSVSPQSASSEYYDSPNQALIFKTSRSPDSIFFGSSSSYNILSQQGVQFIRETSGVTDFPDNLLSQPCWASLNLSPWPQDFYTDLFECRVYKELPPRSEVFISLKTYFATLNPIFPIIDEESFMRMVEWQYTQQTCTDAAIWAIINALLATGIRYRETKSSQSEKDTERAWLYWKNAAAVWTELSLRANNLLGIQALLAMAIFARMNGHMELAIPLITAAMKSAQALGLHRRDAGSSLSPLEQEIRRRVWWCIYNMDEGIGMKTGRGYLQNVDDIDVELPSQVPRLLNEQKCPWSVKLFRAGCSHSVVRSKIYRELYANQAFYKSFDEVCKAADALSAELNQWKHDNPCLSCKLPDSKILSRDHELEVVAHVAHKLYYLNSLALINRMPALFEVASRIATHRNMHIDQDPMEKISAASWHHNLICLHAARDSLSLLEKFPWKDTVYSWALYDFLFFAVSIIFSHILQVPLETEARPANENLRLLNLAQGYFATLAPLQERSKTVALMASLTSIMERTAKKVIEKALKEKNKSPSSSSSQPKSREESQTYVHTLPTDEQNLPFSKDGQAEDVNYHDINILPLATPFAEGLVNNPMSFGMNPANVFSQATNFPYAVQMSPEQNMQMTEAYAHMYTDLYGFDFPSYMSAPVPDTMWAQGSVPGVVNSMPNEGKYDPNMNGDALLEYMWNNNG